MVNLWYQKYTQYNKRFLDFEEGRSWTNSGIALLKSHHIRWEKSLNFWEYVNLKESSIASQVQGSAGKIL